MVHIWYNKKRNGADEYGKRKRRIDGAVGANTDFGIADRRAGNRGTVYPHSLCDRILLLAAGWRLWTAASGNLVSRSVILNKDAPCVASLSFIGGYI